MVTVTSGFMIPHILIDRSIEQPNPMRGSGMHYNPEKRVLTFTNLHIPSPNRSYAHAFLQKEMSNPPISERNSSYSDSSDVGLDNSGSEDMSALNDQRIGNGDEDELNSIFNSNASPKDKSCEGDLDSINSPKFEPLFGLPATDPKPITRSLPPGAVGIHNMGNTCFMNSALQCVSSTVPLTLYFLNEHWAGELNLTNSMGTGGIVAKAYAGLIRKLWDPSCNAPKSIFPRDFRLAISEIDSVFLDYYQHDSQEFLGFLFDVLHEDLNRVTRKVYTEIPDMKNLPDSVVAKKYWDVYKENNDSIISDLFQGQYKSTLECLKCKERSVTFDAYMFLSLPINERATVPIAAYFISLANSCTSQAITKFEFNMPSNSVVRDLKCEIIKRMGIKISEDIIGRYHALVYSFGTTSTILDDLDLLPATSSYKELFVVEMDTCQQDIYHSEEHPCAPRVVLPTYFVRSQDKSTVQRIHKHENLGFPLLLSLPSVMKVPIPPKKVAQLKKQKLSFRDLRSGSPIPPDMYRESLGIIGLRLLSEIISTLRGLMNREYIDSLLNDEVDSSDLNCNSNENYTPPKLFSPRAKSRYLCDIPKKINLIEDSEFDSSEHTDFRSFESSSTDDKGEVTTVNAQGRSDAIVGAVKSDEVCKDADILSKLKPLISRRGCRSGNTVRPKPTKHHANDDEPQNTLEQNAAVYGPLVSKLFNMIKIYISSPSESYNSWPSCDLSMPLSDFLNSKKTNQSLCNVLCFSMDSNDLLGCAINSYITTEASVTKNHGHLARTGIDPPNKPPRSYTSPPHQNIFNNDYEHAPILSSPSPLSYMSKHNPASKSNIDFGQCLSDGSLSPKELENVDAGGDFLHGSSTISAKVSNENPAQRSRSLAANGDHVERGDNLIDDSSSDTSWGFGSHTRDKSSNDYYDFVYKIPPDSVLILECSEGLLENLFNGILVSKDRPSLWNRKEDPGNKRVLEEREEEANRKKNLSLIDCIKAFCKEEVLSQNDSWFCPNCKSYQPARKKLDIWSVPDVIVFHLKRFTSNFRNIRSPMGLKINTNIYAKLEDLDLSEVIIGPKGGHDTESEGFIGSKEAKYDLFAVTNHYGALCGGHYVAYTKNPIDNNWYCFDDSNVYSINSKDVVTSAAYFLLYQRRGSSSRDEVTKALKSYEATSTASGAFIG